MDISNWIAHWSRSTPAKIAVRFDGREITYRSMNERVGSLASGLAKRGSIGQGDRVAYLGPSAPALLELLFACARAGAVFAPLSARMTAAELSVVLGNIQPSLLVTGAGFIEVAHEAARGLDVRILQDLDALAHGTGAVRSDPERSLDAPALILHTSGTTGVPKSVLLTHQALVFNALNGAATLGIRPEDEVLTNLPMSNVGPLNILSTPALAVGATVTIHSQFDPDAVLRELERRRVTLALSPPWVTAALISDERWMTSDLSSLRCVVTGSAITPESLLAPWFERGVPVIQLYGSTETAPIACVSPFEEAFALRHTAGRPAPYCAVRIAAPDGSPLADGEVGEVLVRGPNVMREYWQNPAASSAAFHGGWFRTGDAGSLDEHETLTLVERIKEIIIVGGRNVYPADVEAVLERCPEVAEAAVVASPHVDLGEVPAAFVVLKPDRTLSADEIRRLFDGQLADYKHPHQIAFVDALPRTAAGKVAKAQLRQALLVAVAGRADTE